MSLFHMGELAQFLQDGRVPYLVKMNYQRKWVKSTRENIVRRFTNANPMSRTDSQTGKERLMKIDLKLCRKNIKDVRDNLCLLNIKHDRRYKVGIYRPPPKLKV